MSKRWTEYAIFAVVALVVLYAAVHWDPLRKLVLERKAPAAA